MSGRKLDKKLGGKNLGKNFGGKNFQLYNADKKKEKKNLLPDIKCIDLVGFACGWMVDWLCLWLVDWEYLSGVLIIWKKMGKKSRGDLFEHP